MVEGSGSLLRPRTICGSDVDVRCNVANALSAAWGCKVSSGRHHIVCQPLNISENILKKDVSRSYFESGFSANEGIIALGNTG